MGLGFWLWACLAVGGLAVGVFICAAIGSGKARRPRDESDWDNRFYGES